MDSTFEVLATAAKDHGFLFALGWPTSNLSVAPRFSVYEQEIQTVVYAPTEEISKSFS